MWAELKREPCFPGAANAGAPETCGLPGPVMLWALESPHLKRLMLHGYQMWVHLWSWQGEAWSCLFLGEQLIRQIHPRPGKQAFGERHAVRVCMSSGSVNSQRDHHLTGFSDKSCQAKAQLSILRSEFS